MSAERNEQESEEEQWVMVDGESTPQRAQELQRADAEVIEGSSEGGPTSTNPTSNVSGARVSLLAGGNGEPVAERSSEQPTSANLPGGVLPDHWRTTQTLPEWPRENRLHHYSIVPAEASSPRTVVSAAGLP
ncbi:MAG: hypothetical protein MMC33_003793 [Icmadophila ericetorum]|nr:hypothetical protein [Icmadophila ericetorum]